MTQAIPFSYKGHNHIRVIGDANTPARMWNVTLCTDAELACANEKTRAEFRPMTTHDQHLVAMHFG